MYPLALVMGELHLEQVMEFRSFALEFQALHLASPKSDKTTRHLARCFTQLKGILAQDQDKAGICDSKQTW